MDIDELLIEEVRTHEIIYDLAQAGYKNVKQKEFAWRQVAAAMKMADEECRKRWKGLRDSYKRCKRAEQIASGSGAKRPRKCWKYYEAMSFFDNVTSSRHTIGNISSASSSEEFLVEMLDDSSEDVSSPLPCSSTKKSDSQKFQQFLNFAKASIADTCGAVENTAKKEEDATDIFFAGLAAKFKAANMPPSVLNKLEAKLAAFVFAEIGDHFSQQQ